MTAIGGEILEKVELETIFIEGLSALINVDQTEIGGADSGVVDVIDFEAPKVRPREMSIIETGFAFPKVMRANHESLGTWSPICLAHRFLLPNPQQR